MSIQNFRLYQLTIEYERAIDGLVAGEDGNIDDSLIEAIKGDFDSKAIAVAKYIKNLEAESEAIKEAAKAMTERYKRVQKHAESLTEYLKFNIEKTGLLDAIKTVEFDIKLQKNPPSLIIDDAMIIPDMYKVRREVVDIDNKQLKQDILDGFEVEGARVESRTRLVIK